ncbi:MAG: hypothetical protein GXO26_03845 [Crenarchaeota archaeon]|nr:hypothetical protein [Thermoproteota archaeon]
MHTRVPASVIATRYSWIVPIIVEIRNSEFNRDTLTEQFNISTRLARSVIWVLSKLSLIEKTEKGYRIINEKLIDELSRKIICKKDKKYYIIREGDNIILINIKRYRITVRKVNLKLVEKILSKIQEEKSFTAKSLADDISERVDRVCTVLKIFEICGVVEKSRGEDGRSIYRFRSATDPSLISRLILR